MSVKKRPSRKQTKTAMYILLGAIGAGIIIAGGVYLSQSINLINKYASVAITPNSACEALGLELDRPSTIRATSLLDNSDAYGDVTTYNCLIGEFTTDKVIHGKPIDAYEFGATVMYFEDEAAAETYAEEVVNPLRSWGVKTTEDSIEQSDTFTFIVTDEDWPYYDAYTQHDNAVFRISMPCHDDDVKKDGVACYAQAEAAIEDVASRISIAQ